MAQGNVSRILMTTALNRGQVSEVFLNAPARTGLVAKVVVWAEPFPTLSSYDLETEALSMVTLVPAIESGTIDTWQWEQTGGPPVSLNISGGVATFSAPTTYDGANIVIRVRGIQNSPAQTSSWVSFQIKVRPHCSWKLTGLGWQPINFSTT
jgi:hypothetical protein